MPKLIQFVCDECDFTLKTWSGGIYYVLDNEGKRIKLPHPGEGYKLAQVLGLDEEKIHGFPYLPIKEKEIVELLEVRVGYLSDTICIDCGYVWMLDWDKDELICPKCDSPNIKMVMEMGGQECPICGKGHFEEKDSGIIS